ncbi:unnamed protein product, partial [Allacma fusca]
MHKAKHYSKRHTRRLIKANADLDLISAQAVIVKSPLPTTDPNHSNNIEINPDNFETIENFPDEFNYEVLEEDTPSKNCDNDVEDSDDLKDRLIQWALLHHVTQSALSDLLH